MSRNKTRWNDNGTPGVHGRNGYDGTHGTGEHGQNGGLPSSGIDGGNLTLTLSRPATDILVNEDASDPSNVQFGVDGHGMLHVQAKGGRGGNGGHGGNGGNGAMGRQGRDATRVHAGENGGAGGAGGDPGNGTNGASGGKGGNIHLRLKEEADSYLLLSVASSDNPWELVSGGAGGTAGQHGVPGRGGPGGKGGSHFNWSDGSGPVRHKPAGNTGLSGPDGRPPCSTKPRKGNDGADGSFRISIMGKTKQTFSRRYDLKRVGLDIHSNDRMKKLVNEFQFGDTLKIGNILAENTGGMITPMQLCAVHATPKCGTFEPIKGDDVFIDKRVQPTTIVQASGSLSMFVDVPYTRREDDMEPLRRVEKLYLRCTQYGPREYSKRYENFDREGTLVHLSFPVNNHSGFEGLSNVQAGHGTVMKFKVTNSSLSDLGIRSASKRQVFVQFYRSRNHPGTEIMSHHLDLKVEGEECNSKFDDNLDESTFQGTQIEIDFLPAGQTIELIGSLYLTNQVVPCSSCAIEAEIVLQALSGKGRSHQVGERQFFPSQRRQLLVKSEPTFSPLLDNQVVLVTSSATKRDQFLFWSKLLSERMGLGVEYYSVSLHGTLSPTHEIPNHGLLANLFKDKLIVVLDDIFNPLDDAVSSMAPSCMLPNGCQVQSSGFLPSTKWLLVGASDKSIQQAVSSHYSSPPNDKEYYESISEFFSKFKRLVRDERNEGYIRDERIRDFVIRVKQSTHNKQEKRVAKFLARHDPLRQYLVVVENASKKDDKGTRYCEIVIRRGYSRTANSVYVLEDYPQSGYRGDSSALFGVAMGLPLNCLSKSLIHAAHGNDKVLECACLDSLTQSLLWDVSNALVGEFRVIDDKVKSTFPFLENLYGCEGFRSILATESGASNLVTSKIIARLECVCRSKDLSPWWNPFSHKRAVRNGVQKWIRLLMKDWSSTVDGQIIGSETKVIEEQVRRYTKRMHSCLPAPALNGRWRKGLSHVCSHRNRLRSFTIDFGTHRLVEMETQEYKETSRAIRPRKRVTDLKERRDFKLRARKQMRISDQFLALTEAKRGDMELLADAKVF